MDFIRWLVVKKSHVFGVFFCLVLPVLTFSLSVVGASTGIFWMQLLFPIWLFIFCSWLLFTKSRSYIKKLMTEYKQHRQQQHKQLIDILSDD
jgi:amino acid permease